MSTAEPIPAPSAGEDPVPPLFSVRAFRFFITTRICSQTANQAQAVAVGWWIYDLTGSPLHLGLIGLVQFLPPFLLCLITGQLTDMFDRRLILRCCYTIEVSMSTLLFVLVLMPHPPLLLIYGALLINGVARICEGPTLHSILPSMVPKPLLPSAVAAQASAGKMSNLLGPTLGGLLYGFGAEIDFGLCVLLILCAAVASFLLPPASRSASQQEFNLKEALAGFKLIWRNKALFAAMSLDLLSNLFGGLTALLPIFARDIMQTGPWGLGILRSAPSVGALIVAAYIAHHPIRRGAGWVMLGGMATFGFTTILFGLSTNLGLSLFFLLFVGGGDIISSVVRQTLIQFNTPDEMRGRVFALNSLFVNTGSQLGMFQSGITAEWLGAPGSVLLGGSAVLLTVAVWVWLMPALRKIDRLDIKQPTSITGQPVTART